MIPKIIHYCWFGGSEKTPLIQKCIESWKKVLPEYELREWNESTFDVYSNPFTKAAYLAKKWAFVADYVRLYALYRDGGVYLDTDVKVLRDFSPFLKYSFFTCQESHPDIFNPQSLNSDKTRNVEFSQVLGIGICSAVMGSESNTEFIKECLDYYNSLEFKISNIDNIIIVNILATIIEKYGYKYVLNRRQILKNNMLILEPHYFAGLSTLNKDSYALHLYNGSWVEGGQNFKYKLRNKFPDFYTWSQNLLYKFKGKPCIPQEVEKRLLPCKKVLIVSTHQSHPTDAGNRAAIMAQVMILNNLGMDVHFLFVDMSLRKDNDYSEMKKYWGEKFHIYRLPFLLKVKRYLYDVIRPTFYNGYWKADDHYPNGLATFTNKLNEIEKFDGVIVQYIRLSKLLMSVSIPKKAIFTHDVFSYKDIRVGEPFYETCTASEEAKALQRCDNIFAIQEEEATFCKFLSPRSKVFTVYNPYELHEQPICSTPRLLYLASRMEFNVNGILWFLNNVWEAIIDKYPTLQLFVAGTVCEYIEPDRYRNVLLFGRVDSLDDFYLKGDIVINPVYQGTGLKIKTFEALSYGKTTIVHPHSMNGIYKKDSAPLLCAEEPEEWITLISDLMNGKIDITEQKQKSLDYIERMNKHIEAQYKEFLESK